MALSSSRRVMARFSKCSAHGAEEPHLRRCLPPDLLPAPSPALPQGGPGNGGRHADHHAGEGAADQAGHADHGPVPRPGPRPLLPGIATHLWAWLPLPAPPPRPDGSFDLMYRIQGCLRAMCISPLLQHNGDGHVVPWHKNIGEGKIVSINDSIQGMTITLV